MDGNRKSGDMGGKRVKYLEKVSTSVMDGPKSASIGDSNRACMMQHITHSAVDKCFSSQMRDFKPKFFTFILHIHLYFHVSCLSLKCLVFKRKRT